MMVEVWAWVPRRVSWSVPISMQADRTRAARLEGPSELRLYAVYPHRRFLASKVRAFVETLRATYGDGTKDLWWPETTAVRPEKRRRTKRAATD